METECFRLSDRDTSSGQIQPGRFSIGMREGDRLVPDPVKRLARLFVIVALPGLARNGSPAKRPGDDADTQVLGYGLQCFLEIHAGHPHQRGKSIGMDATGIADAASRIIHVIEHTVSVLAAVHRAGNVMADSIKCRLKLWRKGRENPSPAAMCSSFDFLCFHDCLHEQPRTGPAEMPARGTWEGPVAGR